MMTKVTMIAAIISLLMITIECEIRFAFTFWRDGVREPDTGLNSNNEDVIGEKWSSPGELTPSGMRMHFLFGRRNRFRWTDFMTYKYDSKEIYVKSTDYNRTIMSALSHLQGLYLGEVGPTLTTGQQEKALPPVTSELFTSETNALGANALPNGISVIPVHLFSRDRAYFFYDNPFLCKPIKDMFEQNLKLKQISDLLESIDSTWGSKLKLALNLKDDSYILNFENMNLIANSFVSAYFEDRSLKKFTDAGINLEQFLQVCNEIQFNNNLYVNNGDPFKWFAMIVMTPFLEDVFRWMDTRIENDIAKIEYTGYAAPKLVLYSAHDITLGAAQTILQDAFQDKIKYLYETPFASSFIWELYRPDEKEASTLIADDYTVKITYNEVDYLTVSYPEFKNALKRYMLSTEQLFEFCGWNQRENTPRAYVNATIILSILLFFAIIGLIILFLIFKKISKSDKIALNQEPKLNAL
jgi:hypothetical protein